MEWGYAGTERAARVIEGLSKGVGSLLTAGRDLSELPGIGEDLVGKIAGIVKTGHFDLLDSLKKQLPGQLSDMVALPGLGPKRVKLLYDKLKVRTLDDLHRVIKAGRLRELRGFGPAIVWMWHFTSFAALQHHVGYRVYRRHAADVANERRDRQTANRVQRAWRGHRCALD